MSLPSEPGASDASLARLAETWNRLGAEDPLWAILSDDAKRGNRWERAEFFATGEREIEAALAHVRALVPLRSARALDFGCGVGRLTQALARRFERVDGVDAAASMIEHARRLNEHGERCTYHLNARADLAPFADGSFDFVYSSLTLQHMQPALARGYILELCRVLAPGGVLLFQLPTRPARPPSPLRRVLRAGYRLWLRRVRRRALIDMFGTPEVQVEALVRGAGCRLLDVADSHQSGSDWHGRLYSVVRASAPGHHAGDWTAR